MKSWLLFLSVSCLVLAVLLVAEAARPIPAPVAAPALAAREFKLHLVELAGCQYVVYEGQGGNMVHHENCKYCQARREDRERTKAEGRAP